MRDTSLRVPPGVAGTVVDVKIFSRSGIRKDRRYKQEILKQIEKMEQGFAAQIRYLEQMLLEKIANTLDKKVPESVVSAKKFIKNKFFDKSVLLQTSLSEVMSLLAKDDATNDVIKNIKNAYENQMRILIGLKEERVNKLKKGDPLPSGVIKVVKVYIAMKRLISVGDKLAGRHGNKGVVSIIVPREDMPFLDDGTPVDIVLNPLGVPSRMNVGQILETALGLVGKRLGVQLEGLMRTKGDAAINAFMAKMFGNEFVKSFENEFGKDMLKELARYTAKQGVHFETPVFDGANLDSDIKPMMKDLGLPTSGNFKLCDGRTGDYFEQPVTVGSIYMMKLNHMVDDKLHARSVGPYSLVTQQPLGGKAQMGGQRLGEMEVWALEAYGAAYTLQEMLTYKSDDVSGRHKVYEAIVRDENIPEPGVPESFNVLIKELQSLGLQVDLFKSGKENVGE